MSQSYINRGTHTHTVSLRQDNVFFIMFISWCIYTHSTVICTVLLESQAKKKKQSQTNLTFVLYLMKCRLSHSLEKSKVKEVLLLLLLLHFFYSLHREAKC